MSARSYFILCLGIIVLLPAALLYIPGFSDIVEQVVLLFLSRNA